jgi:hypothetical protein
LGTNFANYEGILPQNKGGSSIDKWTNGTSSNTDLRPGGMSISYAHNQSGQPIKYLRVAIGYSLTNGSNSGEGYQTLLVSGFGFWSPSTNSMPNTYLVQISSSLADQKVIAFPFFSDVNCNNSNDTLGYYYITAPDSNRRLYVYVRQPQLGTGITSTWINFNAKPGFSPNTRTDIPIVDEIDPVTEANVVEVKDIPIKCLTK